MVIGIAKLMDDVLDAGAGERCRHTPTSMNPNDCPVHAGLVGSV